MKNIVNKIVSFFKKKPKNVLKYPNCKHDKWIEGPGGGSMGKLTVNECCRLQTVPDNYFKGLVSDTQAYKMLGNGWTIDIIAFILSFIKRPEFQ